MKIEFLKFIELLNDFDVDYVVIGGLAVNIYGYQRMTEDVDLLFEPKEANINKLTDALEAFGFDTVTIRNHNLKQPTHLRLGEYPNSIDLINSTKGIDLQTVFKKAKIVTMGKTMIKVISLEDLIKNKKALGTYKDLADAEELIKLQKSK